MYSIVPSRAGLAVLAFVLIISLVSAVPIPLSASLSSTLSDHNGQVHCDVINISRNSPISTTVPATTSGATVNNPPIDTSNYLVRRSFFSHIGAAFSKAGHAIAHVAHKIGGDIKRVVKKVGSGIKRVAQKIHTVANKVGTFVKHAAGATKFGLKVTATVTEAAGKVAGFFPGFGKIAGKVLEGVSKGANMISDKIPAHLSGKMEAGMNFMNKADKIMRYIPMRRELSGEHRFQQWDDI